MHSSTAEVLADDFWDPLSVPGPILRANEDFWSPVQTPPEPTIFTPSIWEFDEAAPSKETPAADWSTGALPWFDADRAEDPRVLVFAPPTVEHLALKRGRWISIMLDIPTTDGRRRCAEFLQEVFTRFPSRAAFQALADVALGGAGVDDFVDGCRFRMELMDHPYFAVRRNGRHPPTTPQDPQTLLSWPRAVRLAELAGGDPLQCVEDDWLPNWISLHPGHEGYWSFVDYIEWRLRAAASFSFVAYEALPNSDRIKARMLLGSATPRSRTAALVKVDKGHIGVLDLEPIKPRFIRRTSI